MRMVERVLELERERVVVLLVALHVLPLVDGLGQVHLAQRQLDLNKQHVLSAFTSYSWQTE